MRLLRKEKRDYSYGPKRAHVLACFLLFTI
jgi:hypothetical protein